MATALDLLNNVLRGLRRDVLNAVTTTDSYQLLLIQMLNTAKRQIETRWDWQALRTTVTVTLAAGTETYTLSAAGSANVDVTDRARLLYEKQVQYGGSWDTYETSTYSAGVQPQVFDTTGTAEYRLVEIPWERFERLRLTDDNTQNQPAYFALRRTSGYMQLGVWPQPSGTRTLSMRFVIPQAVIPSTFMTGYTLSIPDAPVWTQVVARAAAERGEDVGRDVSALQDEADQELYDAISLEQSDADLTGEPV